MRVEFILTCSWPELGLLLKFQKGQLSVLYSCNEFTYWVKNEEKSALELFQITKIDLTNHENIKDV